jgi:hypothetical protein
MGFVQVLWYYILWHYTKAWADLLRIIGNYFWFVSNFFSINLLLQTLFSPWRRLSISGGRGGEESFIGALIINTIMRFVGFFARIFTIVFGIVALAVTAALSVAAILVWLFLPVIVFLLFFAGLGYIIGVLSPSYK